MVPRPVGREVGSQWGLSSPGAEYAVSTPAGGSVVSATCEVIPCAVTLRRLVVVAPSGRAGGAQHVTAETKAGPRNSCLGENDGLLSVDLFLVKKGRLGCGEPFFLFYVAASFSPFLLLLWRS